MKVKEEKEEKSMNSHESDLKNYKSLFEEIAQNDSEIYLTKSFHDAIRFGISDDDSGNNTRCCCCKVHRKQNASELPPPTSSSSSAASFITGGAVTNTKSFNVPTNIYNTIWMGEMKNATDYIEYLNETRRNSFSSLNKDNRSNYYNLMRGDYHSLTTTDGDIMSVRDSGISGCEGKNFLQVPKHILPQDHMRRTPEFKDISKRIDQLQELDSNVSSLIYKSIEVHADILVCFNFHKFKIFHLICISNL